MKKHQNTIGKTDEWLTPPEIIKALGEFDLDPADIEERQNFGKIMPPTAKNSFCVDGLDPKTIWKGRGGSLILFHITTIYKYRHIIN